MHMQHQLTTPLLTHDVDWTSTDLEPQLSQVLHERPHGLEIGGCISCRMSTSGPTSDLFSLGYPRGPPQAPPRLHQNTPYDFPRGSGGGGYMPPHLNCWTKETRMTCIP
ncbi:hypothetical protein B0H14DRAFT_3130021, partial [Mycena olivaceomarginata]